MQHLALMFDAPLQSWGFASRFQRRATGLHPTKSGVLGLLCAAMGIPKGSPRERELLPRFARLRLTTVLIPRSREGVDLRTRQLEDFHTVLGTRRAGGTMNPDPVVTRRQYLLDARFGVLLAGDDSGILENLAAAALDPRWGVWFGRKSCLPASPIYRAGPCTEEEAWRTLIGDLSRDRFERTEEVDRFEDGDDSINDQPVSYGSGDSSGPEGRSFVARRVKLHRPREPESTD